MSTSKYSTSMRNICTITANGEYAVQRGAALAGIEDVRITGVADVRLAAASLAGIIALATLLQEVAFATPALPVLSNVTGAPHAADGAAIRETMLRQVTEPVRWMSCVRAAGAQTFIEFGPGKVLSGLIKRIDRQNLVANVQDATSLESVADIASA